MFFFLNWIGEYSYKDIVEWFVVVNLGADISGYIEQDELDHFMDFVEPKDEFNTTNMGTSKVKSI